MSMSLSETVESFEKTVSVIMPTYNSADFVQASIESVLNQSYRSLELIVIDDCSTDNTRDLVQALEQKDPRVRLLVLDNNEGAGAARNKGVEFATGNYIAFLDSDDIWMENKLAYQIDFMNTTGAVFTCTDYSIIDEKGHPTGGYRKSKTKYDYRRLLRHTPGNSTVVYNADKLGKTYIPPIRKRNDYVMWLAVIKKAGELRGISNNLTRYRSRQGGLSSNKLSLVRYHWEIYTKIEGLPKTRSYLLIFYWVFKTVARMSLDFINRFGKESKSSVY